MLHKHVGSLEGIKLGEAKIIWKKQQICCFCKSVSPIHKWTKRLVNHVCQKPAPYVGKRNWYIFWQKKMILPGTISGYRSYLHIGSDFRSLDLKGDVLMPFKIVNVHFFWKWTRLTIFVNVNSSQILLPPKPFSLAFYFPFWSCLFNNPYSGRNKIFIILKSLILSFRKILEHFFLTYLSRESNFSIKNFVIWFSKMFGLSEWYKGVEATLTAFVRVLNPVGTVKATPLAMHTAVSMWGFLLSTPFPQR